LLFGFLRAKSLLIRAQELSRSELMKKKHLISFCSGILK
jgi:hypothetical protein